ncbi:MAG: hypothetical protein IKR47_05580 [Lachnospiraceae bacterium]|nr:hypothetical protein [Lachnospiraceae bacterium]
MNRFQKPNLGKRILQSVNFSILFFVAIIGVFLFGIATVSSGTAEDERRILDEAIHKDIVHCYAVEGMYPPTITYMEEHYGLTYDHDKFLVDYETIGSNIMPNVTIIERSGK